MSLCLCWIQKSCKASPKEYIVYSTNPEITILGTFLSALQLCLLSGTSAARRAIRKIPEQFQCTANTSAFRKEETICVAQVVLSSDFHLLCYSPSCLPLGYSHFCALRSSKHSQYKQHGTPDQDAVIKVWWHLTLIVQKWIHHFVAEVACKHTRMPPMRDCVTMFWLAILQRKGGSGSLHQVTTTRKYGIGVWTILTGKASPALTHFGNAGDSWEGYYKWIQPIVQLQCNRKICN